MPPGADKYLDIGRITGHLTSDANNLAGYLNTRFQIYVKKLSKN